MPTEGVGSMTIIIAGDGEIQSGLKLTRFSIYLPNRVDESDSVYLFPDKPCFLDSHQYGQRLQATAVKFRTE